MLEQGLICIGCPLGCHVTLKVSAKGEIETLNSKLRYESLRQHYRLRGAGVFYRSEQISQFIRANLKSLCGP
jgi:hypothetical protein